MNDIVPRAAWDTPERHWRMRCTTRSGACAIYSAINFSTRECVRVYVCVPIGRDSRCAPSDGGRKFISSASLPREHPLSPPREAIDMFDIYSGHFFIYRSLFAADPRDPRVKIAIINAASDDSSADVNYLSSASRRGAWAAHVCAVFVGDACTAAHAREWERVSTREYP